MRRALLATVSAVILGAAPACAFAQLADDQTARGLAAAAYGAQHGPGGAIDLRDPAYGITLTTPTYTPSAAQKTANLAIIRAAIAKACLTANVGGFASEAPGAQVLLPAGLIDGPTTQSTTWGDMRVPATSGGWGCIVDGVPGRTILRANAPDLPFFQMGNHRIMLRGVTMVYATQEGVTAAALQNWDGGHGGHCVELVYWMMGELAYDQCYNATEMFLIPFEDGQPYGNAIAGNNTAFSSSIHDNYTSGNSYRAGSLSTSRTAKFTGSISGNTLTVDPGSATGSPIALNATVFTPTIGGMTPATITAGSGLSWTLSGSAQTIADTALESAAVSQGGTGMTMTNNYSGGNGGAAGANGINACWVLYGVAVISTVRNCESSPIGMSTPAIGAGGDGNGELGVNLVSVTGGKMSLDHFENLTFKVNNLALFGWVSGTNVTLENFDYATLTATTASGATNLYWLRPFGSNAHVVVNGGSEGGATPGNTLTNNIGLVYPGSTLNHTTIDFGRIFEWAAASQLTQNLSVPTNDVPVWRSGGAPWAPATLSSNAVTVIGLRGQITTASLTTASAANSAVQTVTDTNNINASSEGVTCKVNGGTYTTGTPEVMNLTYTANQFSFVVHNSDSTNALNGTVKVYCTIDNNAD